MSLTLDLFRIQTVPPDYSWDEGTPLITYPDNKLITNLSPLSTMLRGEGFGKVIENYTDAISSVETVSATDFIGYAPFVSIALSSEIVNHVPLISTIFLERTIDFGDYYNSETNFQNAIGEQATLFCHNYIMPGTYTVILQQKDHIAVKKTHPDFTDYPGLYIQPVEKPQRLPLSWQWNNFYSFSLLNPRNTPITWEQTTFQGPEELSWYNASGPCYEFPFTDTFWKWSGVVCDLSANPYSKDIPWNLTKSTEDIHRTWKQLYFPDCYELVPDLSTVDTSYIDYYLLEVKEIFPTAYLSAIDLTPNKESPLTVRLTPKFTRAGSFPIEKIVWDLGDGSPLLTQRRWAPNFQSPFAFSNTLTGDWQDPRNYDVVHTYKKTLSSGFSFYPSITAYASSTSSTNCAATVIGPLKLKSPTIPKFKLLHNELTNHGKTLIGEVDGVAAVWRDSVSYPTLSSTSTP